MFGLLGLLGFLVAGMASDAMAAATEDEDEADLPEDAAEDAPVDDGATADLIAQTFGETNPDGMPISDDLPDPVDPDQVIYGTSGSDVLNGGGGDDLMRGGPSGDQMSGGDGADRIFGGSGDDEASGGSGDDRLLGRVGDDSLRGDAGEDVLRGGAGDDYLSGGAGDDLLSGGAGDDTVLGGDGADILRGGGGADWLAGGEGADSLSGGAGNDTLDGGAGNDTLEGGPGQDYVNAGAGDDLLRLSDDTYATGDAGRDTFEVMTPGSSVIADYNAAEDQIVVVYEADASGQPPEVSLRIEGDDALILMDGQVLARVSNGAGLTLDDLQLRAG